MFASRSFVSETKNSHHNNFNSEFNIYIIRVFNEFAVKINY